MYAGKPIIGIAGGIGSGKSFVARIFGELGCLVIDSDQQVREAYEDPETRQTLVQWWGPGAIKPDGAVDRKFIAGKVFADADERRKLEHLLHPKVAEARDRLMARHAGDAQVLAYVWDTPLLFETGLNEQCDAVVFVDTPLALRQARVAKSRGWSVEELNRRENSQMPLDKKAEISDHVVRNTTDADDEVRSQVRAILSRILAGTSPRSNR